MGKIRVKTIGIEEDEKTEKKKAKERAEAKRIEAAKKLGQETKAEAAERQKVETASVNASEEKAEKASEEPTKKAEKAASAQNSGPLRQGSSEASEPKKEKKEKFQVVKKKPHSSAYSTISDLVDKNKKYTLSEALEILPKLKRAKFDETVELHINTNEKGVSGSITLPHGTGKQTKVEIADQTNDPKKVEGLIKKITAGQIDFDILIATPDTMPKLAVVARFLGPRGLMPNPKNDTIHPKPQEAAKKFEGGQINFKTEAKAPIIHLAVGKVSFGEKQLQENIKTVLTAVQNKNIKNVTLKSTMSPGIKLAV